LPRLFICGSKDTLPWAAEVFDKGGGGDPKREREPERPRPTA
jgi:hypothetical protein